MRTVSPPEQKDHPMPVFLSRYLVVLVATASLGAFAYVQGAGGPLELVVLLASATTLLLASILERYFPLPRRLEPVHGRRCYRLGQCSHHGCRG